MATDENIPMFQMSQQPDSVTSANNLDLDELFAECYFDGPGWNGSSAVSAASAEAPGSSTDAIPAAIDTTLSTEATQAEATSSTAEPQQDAGTAAAAATTTTTTTTTATSAVTSTRKKRSAEDADLFGDDESGLTEKQKLERRERNREHAKRSRLRKKFLLESLQEQIHGLQEQMDQLKEALKEYAGQEKADEIIHNICGNKEKYQPLPMPSGFGPVKTLMEPDFRLMSALSGSQQNFAISDPTLPDNPIVYVSQGFLDLTGYTLDQVLGRNCRFLQGPGTDQNAVDVIRKGINEGIDTSVCLLNYKADGTPFWNQFFVAALRDAENNVVNYVGVQCEVSKAVVEKHLGDQSSKGAK